MIAVTAELCFAWRGTAILMLLAVTVNCADLTQYNPSQCDNVKSPMEDYKVHKGRRGLNAMCEAAEGTRKDIIGEELPYEFVAEQAKAWHDTGEVDESEVVRNTFRHLRNIFYLTSFFIFLGITIPVMSSILWLVWQRCDDGEQDDEMKNSSYQEQVFAWLLGVGLLLCSICMIVFLSFLIVSNSLIVSGAKDGTDTVVKVLPQAESLRNDVISGINKSFVTDLDNLLDSLNRTHIMSSNITHFLENEILSCIGNQSSQILNDIDAVVNSSLKLYDLILELRMYANEISEGSTSFSLSFASAVLGLKSSLESLEKACDDLPTNATESCDHLLEGISLVSSLDGINVEVDIDFSIIIIQLSNITNGINLLVEKIIQDFEVYPNDTANNLTNIVRRAYDAYRQKLIDEAVNQTNSIISPLVRMHLGLPRSQRRLQRYVDDSNVDKWTLYNYNRSITFTVVIITLLLCICFAVYRGTYNIYYIYLCGNDPSLVRKAHQAGVMLKKLAYCFYVVCFITSLVMSISLLAGGAVGSICGESRNFSEIMTNVIDDYNTWGGEYPFAKMVLGDPSYPLTYQKVLDGCRHGDNLYTVLDLEKNNYSVANYHPVNVTIDKFTQDLSSISIEAPNLVDDELQFHLMELNNATPAIATFLEEWKNYFNKTVVPLHPIYEGLVNLQSHLLEMVLDESSNNSNLTFAVWKTLSDLDTVLALLNSSNFPKIIEIVKNASTELEFIKQQNITAILMEAYTKSSRYSQCGYNTIVSISNHTVKKLLEFEGLARTCANCSIKTCQEIAELYDRFSSGLCKDVLDGTDLFWASLACVFIISIVIIVLCLILASRFVDYTLSRVVKFSLWDSGLRQAMALVWIVILVSADIWVISDIRSDQSFHSSFCENHSSSCCASCVWGFGIFFLLIFMIVGFSSRFYQCLLVYRIYVFDQLKVRKYWHIRKKSIQFYTQLFVFFVQDLPFLIIPGLYFIAITRPVDSVQACLLVCFIDICVYVIYIVRERRNVHLYVNWSRKELQRYYSCFFNRKTTGMSRYSPGCQHGNSEDDDNDESRRYLETSHSPYQGREVVNDEFVYEESRYPDQESPDNLAHVTLEARSASVTGGESQVIGVDDYELEEEESEVSDSNESDHDQASQNNVGLLDRQLDPDNEALRLRQEAARLHAQIAAGVDVAMPLHVTGLHGDNLYMFSSIGSFEPTSSQYVDESSDYRDDDESDYDNRWHSRNLSQFYTADV